MDPEAVTRFPVAHKTLLLHIKGISTDVVISSYDDYIGVMVTQVGSMGTILHARLATMKHGYKYKIGYRKEECVSTDPTFNVSVIFGKRDEPLLIACARQLIEQISMSSSKPLLLSLGLKDHSLETCKAIITAVIDNRIW